MSIKNLLKKNFFLNILVGVICIVLFFVYMRGGLDTVHLDSDIGRDLGDMSDLWIGNMIIWLGPRLSPGLHASPIYYYMYYPVIWLSNGNAHSIIVLNIVFGLIALGIVGCLSIRKWGINGLLPMLFIGLSPLFITHITHPGNGYSYIIWMIMGLTFLWFEFPLVLAALFIGLSTAYHPAAIFGIPLLVYEWGRRKHSFISAILILLGLLIPWSPIILFEIITKGYITRQWLMNKSTGVGVSINLANWNKIFGYIFVNPILGFLAMPLIIFIAKKRLLVWVILNIFNLVIFYFIAPVLDGYAFGVTSILLFTVPIVLMQKRFGQIILGVFIIYFLINIFFLSPFPTNSPRSISRIQGVVNQLVTDNVLKKDKKIAVVAVMEELVRVPQADDYRFFLRVKGYEVVKIEQNADADILVMFIEVPKFNWEKWSSWEVSQFGDKKLVHKKVVNGVLILTFSKATP